MSMAALRWARDVDPAIGLVAKAVLRDLADRANDSGVCWPSITTIAADTGIHRRSVTRALRRLENAELVRIRLIPGRGSRYVLVLPPEPMTESHDTHDRESRPHDRESPKASISLSEAKPWAAPADKPKENAAAYRKTDVDLPDPDVDPTMVDLARRWLNPGDR